MLTRDSVVWTLGFFAAVIGYLLTAQKPPTAWSYMEWLQALSFVVAWVMGRLANSPLAGDATPRKESYAAWGGLVRMKDTPKDVTD